MFPCILETHSACGWTAGSTVATPSLAHANLLAAVQKNITIPTTLFSLSSHFTSWSSYSTHFWAVWCLKKPLHLAGLRSASIRSPKAVAVCLWEKKATESAQATCPVLFPPYRNAECSQWHFLRMMSGTYTDTDPRAPSRCHSKLAVSSRLTAPRSEVPRDTRCTHIRKMAGSVPKRHSRSECTNTRTCLSLHLYRNE